MEMTIPQLHFTEQTNVKIKGGITRMTFPGWCVRASFQSHAEHRFNAAHIFLKYQNLVFSASYLLIEVIQVKIAKKV